MQLVPVPEAVLLLTHGYHFMLATSLPMSLLLVENLNKLLTPPHTILHSHKAFVAAEKQIHPSRKSVVSFLFIYLFFNFLRRQLLLRLQKYKQIQCVV